MNFVALLVFFIIAAWKMYTFFHRAILSALVRVEFTITIWTLKVDFKSYNVLLFVELLDFHLNLSKSVNTASEHSASNLGRSDSRQWWWGQE